VLVIRGDHFCGRRRRAILSSITINETPPQKNSGPKSWWWQWIRDVVVRSMDVIHRARNIIRSPRWPKFILPPSIPLQLDYLRCPFQGSGNHDERPSSILLPSPPIDRRPLTAAAEAYAVARLDAAPTQAQKTPPTLDQRRVMTAGRGGSAGEARRGAKSFIRGRREARACDSHHQRGGAAGVMRASST
jgi:hypothetical protein